MASAQAIPTIAREGRRRRNLAVFFGMGGRENASEACWPKGQKMLEEHPIFEGETAPWLDGLGRANASM